MEHDTRANFQKTKTWEDFPFVGEEDGCKTSPTFLIRSALLCQSLGMCTSCWLPLSSGAICDCKIALLEVLPIFRERVNHHQELTICMIHTLFGEVQFSRWCVLVRLTMLPSSGSGAFLTFDTTLAITIPASPVARLRASSLPTSPLVNIPPPTSHQHTITPRNTHHMEHSQQKQRNTYLWACHAHACSLRIRELRQLSRKSRPPPSEDQGPFIQTKSLVVGGGAGPTRRVQVSCLSGAETSC